MKRSVAAALAIFAVTAAISQQAAAAPVTLFESIPNVSSGDFTGRLVSLPNSYAYSYRVYSAFTLEAAATITSADFLVANYGSLPTQGELGIYSAFNGQAGDQLFSQTLSTTAMTAVADPFAWGIPLNRVTVDPTDFALNAGSYFISLAGADWSAFAIPTFALDDVANPVRQSAFSYQSLTNDRSGIAAYSISGISSDLSAEVPEPSVLALFGLGAAGALLARRRKLAGKHAQT